MRKVKLGVAPARLDLAKAKAVVQVLGIFASQTVCTACGQCFATDTQAAHTNHPDSLPNNKLSHRGKSPFFATRRGTT